MRNLLQETIEVLKENSKTFDDVVWIGCKEFRITLAQFKELANKHYVNGYGGIEVAKDLLIVGEDWWLERGEYDGSEWWEFKKILKFPTTTRSITTLFVPEEEPRYTLKETNFNTEEIV